MIFSVATRRLLAWCALVAMLMGAVAPGISRVVAAASPGNPIALADTLAEICTVGDGRGDAPAAVHAATPGHLKLHLDHCAYCHLAGDAPGLPVSCFMPMPAATIVALQPLLFLQAPRTLHAWRAAQPRAPPILLS